MWARMSAAHMAPRNLPRLGHRLRLTRYTVQRPLLSRVEALPAQEAPAKWYHSAKTGLKEQPGQPTLSDQKDQRAPWFCPACKQPHWNLARLTAHITKCCPDLCRERDKSLNLATEEYLQMLSERESRSRQNLLQLMYKHYPDKKVTEQDAANQMDLPLHRITRMARMARKSVPIFANHAPIEVLYEDEDIIAVNKPAGITSTPAHRHIGNSVLNRLTARLGFAPLTIHRLDIQTSGVHLFAKNKTVVNHLQEQFRLKTLVKEYVAIICGRPPEAFIVDAPVSRHSENKFMRAVGSDGQHALTRFALLASSSIAPSEWAWCEHFNTDRPIPREMSIVKCIPETGRTHQIRLHLAHRGNPIIGDDLYGILCPQIDRQALHAHTLTIVHPATLQPLSISAPLPEDMMQLLCFAGLEFPSSRSTL